MAYVYEIKLHEALHEDLVYFFAMIKVITY